MIKRDDDPDMDLWTREYGSDIAKSVNHAKHGTVGDNGGFNRTFEDGSVRSAEYGAAVDPKNLWGVTELFRETISAEL